MADKYSTIQQHQPLRVPARWDKQEKALIVQLDEILDDLYRRFGRLGMQDMSKKFRLTIEGKYDVVSGIDITEEGIDVSGAKYVNIHSGGTFDVDSDNFKINSQNKLMQAGDWVLNNRGIDFKGQFSIAEFPTPSGESKTEHVRFCLVTGEGAGSTTLYGLGMLFDHEQYSVYFGPEMADFHNNRLVFGPDAGDWFLGTGSKPWKNGYFKNLIADELYNGSNVVIDTYNASSVRVSADRLVARDEIEVGSNTAILNSQNQIYFYGKQANIDDIYYTNLHPLSSRLLKNDIKPLASAGERLDKLWPVSFVYSKDENKRVHQGLVYEDTVDVLPEICYEDGKGTKGIDYIELVPILLKEIQDLRKRVAILEGKRNV